MFRFLNEMAKKHCRIMLQKKSVSTRPKKQHWCTKDAHIHLEDWSMIIKRRWFRRVLPRNGFHYFACKVCLYLYMAQFFVSSFSLGTKRTSALKGKQDICWKNIGFANQLKRKKERKKQHANGWLFCLELRRMRWWIVFAFLLCRLNNGRLEMSVSIEKC